MFKALAFLHCRSGLIPGSDVTCELISMLVLPFLREVFVLVPQSPLSTISRKPTLAIHVRESLETIL